MHEFITIAFFMLAAHWICDYPLQGEYLSKAKSINPMRVYHLIAHAGIHGGAVALVTGNIWLGLAEWIAHTAIDEMKVRGWISFERDQQLHIACKALWLFLMILLT